MPAFSTHTNRELVAYWNDGDGSLSWQLALEQELELRGYTPRRDGKPYRLLELLDNNNAPAEETPPAATRETNRSTPLEKLAAEVSVLRRHDHAMWTARFDFGAGQRARELRRVNGLLEERGRFVSPAEELAFIEALPAQLLLETFERVAVPRMRRMSPTRRGAWLHVLYEIARLPGVELLPDRDELEEQNGSPVDVDSAVELWAMRHGVS